MFEFALALVVLAPIGSAMFLIGTSSLYWSWIPAAALAAGGLFNYFSGNWDWPRSASRWLWPFMAFLAVGTVSLLVSPYRGAAMVKGTIQIVGMLMMLLAVLALSTLVRERRAFLFQMLRWTSLTLGVIGAIAIVQFVVNNIVRFPLVNFEVFQLFGGGTAWRPPGQIGGIFRANSIEGEPAHLTTYLSMGVGLAFVRLGGLGGSLKQSPLVRNLMPQWAAIGIVGGFATSLSLIGYMGFAIGISATAFTWFVMRARKKPVRKVGRRRWLGAVAVLACVVLVPLLVGGNLVEKLSTLAAIYNNPAASDDDLTLVGASQLVSTGGDRLSALTLAVNGGIMLDNLHQHPLLGVGIGAHPVSYDEKVPDYVDMVPALKGMNQDDAAALIIRLLSETGVIGAVIFVFGGLWVAWRGMCATRLCSYFPGDARDSVAPLLAALTGSWIAVFFLYLARLGLYFSSAFWMSMAFVILTTEVAVASAAMSPLRPRLPRGIWRLALKAG